MSHLVSPNTSIDIDELAEGSILQMSVQNDVISTHANGTIVTNVTIVGRNFWDTALLNKDFPIIDGNGKLSPPPTHCRNEEQVQAWRLLKRKEQEDKIELFCNLSSVEKENFYRQVPGINFRNTTSINKIIPKKNGHGKKEPPPNYRCNIAEVQAWRNFSTDEQNNILDAFNNLSKEEKNPLRMQVPGVLKQNYKKRKHNNNLNEENNNSNIPQNDNNNNAIDNLVNNNSSTDATEDRTEDNMQQLEPHGMASADPSKYAPSTKRNMKRKQGNLCPTSVYEQKDITVQLATQKALTEVANLIEKSHMHKPTEMSTVDPNVGVALVIYNKVKESPLRERNPASNVLHEKGKVMIMTSRREALKNIYYTLQEYLKMTFSNTTSTTTESDKDWNVLFADESENLFYLSKKVKELSDEMKALRALPHCNVRTQDYIHNNQIESDYYKTIGVVEYAERE